MIGLPDKPTKLDETKEYVLLNHAKKLFYGQLNKYGNIDVYWTDDKKYHGTIVLSTTLKEPTGSYKIYSLNPFDYALIKDTPLEKTVNSLLRKGSEKIS